MPQNPKFNAGADLSITFRIPESDTYKASEWSTATTYTLKAPGTDNSEIFANHYGAFLWDKARYDSGISANSFESNGFVVYKDGNLLKFGKIASVASSTETGMYDYTFTPLESLTEEDKTEVAKFEYKFVSKLEYEQTDAYSYTSFILLVRIKATDSTAHSRVHVLEYQLSYEPVE